jgi:hypothetical protein
MHNQTRDHRGRSHLSAEAMRAAAGKMASIVGGGQNVVKVLFGAGTQT